ncbi:MAG: hypothetical protein N2258_03935 [Brevinematales bacterium]|nr:hypothetical protein [Brevinematales bacterium]
MKYLFFLFLAQQIFAADFVLNIEVGKHFVQTGKIGIFSFTTTPQMVLWVESEDGKYKETIWMTRRFAKQDWAGQSYDKNKIYREYTFPRWVYVFKDNLPTKNKPMPDSVTGASPKSSTKINIKLPIDKKLILYFEVNNAFDENESYPMGKLYDGQPSLVYTAVIDSDFKDKIELKLKYKTNLKGELIENLDGITTAKEIISKVEILKSN